MDNLKTLKSFLSDLITPIVKSAVGEAIPEAIKDKEKNLVPVQKITEMYGISQSKVYYLFSYPRPMRQSGDVDVQDG